MDVLRIVLFLAPVKAETVTEENSTETTVKKVSKKKKWKGKKKKPAVDSEGTVVRLPEKPEVISCNWKNLLKTIEAEKATQKPKQNPSIFFRYISIFSISCSGAEN
jgi:hypothetical protein